MNLSYDGLWKMLNNLNITKMEFAKNIGISNATLAKLGKNESVSLTVLMRICEHYNCKIENIVKFVPDTDIIYPDITTLKIGTILICTLFPLETPVKIMELSKQTNISKKHPCVILQECLNDGYTPKILVAPLLYGISPDTIFDVQFKNLKLDANFIKCGYIQLGKMGFVFQKDTENILGHMPDIYMNDTLKLLEKIKPIIKL